MLKAAIVGAGYIAEFHAQAYLSEPHVQLSLIFDPNLEKALSLASRYQAQAIANFEDLLNSDVDLVSICTPTPSHVALAKALLQNGKHVLCEKPISRTLEEAQELINFSATVAPKLMIGHVARYEVDHIKAKALLERGAIGQLKMAYHAIVGPYPAWSTNNWLGDVSRSGGPVLDLAIHSVDSLLWFFNQPVVSVFASGSQPGSQNNQKNHYVLLNLQFANGGLGLVEASWAHPAQMPQNCRVELSGDLGRITWDYPQISALKTFQTDVGAKEYTMEGENSFATQIADFVHCIQNDLPVPIPASAGAAALRVCLAALESLETGKCIALSEEV